MPLEVVLSVGVLAGVSVTPASNRVSVVATVFTGVPPIPIGAVEPGRPKSVAAARFRLMAPVALLSAFINNTPVVTLCVPLVRNCWQRIGVSPSKLLMPLSYASIPGGLLTLIGSASNLTVMALHVESVRAKGLPAPNFGLRFWGSLFVGPPAGLIGTPYRRFGFPNVGGPQTLILAVLCALICPLAVPFRPGP